MIFKSNLNCLLITNAESHETDRDQTFPPQSFRPQKQSFPELTVCGVEMTGSRNRLLSLLPRQIQYKSSTITVLCEK